MSKFLCLKIIFQNTKEVMKRLFFARNRSRKLFLRKFFNFLL